MKDDVRAAVFLLAQNRLLREALSRILSNKDDIAVVGSSALTELSFRDVVNSAPDVLVIDSFFTSTAYLDLVRELQQKLNGLKLVVIGMDVDNQHFLQAIREGAMGYLARDASALEVVAAVRTVANGGAVCSSALCAFLFRFAAQQNHMPSFHVRKRLGLTNREQQIVGLISRGLTNKEIGRQLQLAENTVRNHIHRMLRKLGVSHRLAAVDACRMEGIPV
jgi:two-component system, NarL family, response regulator DevR